MPKQYTAMRNKFKKEGMSDKGAKGKAARIYNASHPGKPMRAHVAKRRGK